MTLYKFLTATRAIKVLESGLIRFSQLASLNDPFESFPPLDGFLNRDRLLRDFDTIVGDQVLYNTILTETIDKMYANLDSNKKTLLDKQTFSILLKQHVATRLAQAGTDLTGFLRNTLDANSETLLSQFRERARAILSDNVCVLSLSAARANSLMWAHYADAHRGVAIGFDSNNRFLSEAIAVQYHSTRPTFDVPTEPTSEQEKRSLQVHLLGTKNISWHYEEEFRVVAASTILELLDQPDRRGFPVFVSPFPRESVAEVILGSKVGDNDASVIRQVVASNYPGIQLLKVTLDTTGFTISFNPV